ncbi:hypothetical protein E2C01_023668 [Portunus trituberculatus]|uniref:Uncharacterized protein n=1 Tax=Portunus trituberculatus TaxID=210409 RepID=A0A5B7EC71_PORTR|nr:hypothetical protein [Portunus trituberculatus]
MVLKCPRLIRVYRAVATLRNTSLHSFPGRDEAPSRVLECLCGWRYTKAEAKNSRDQGVHCEPLMHYAAQFKTFTTTTLFLWPGRSSQCLSASVSHLSLPTWRPLSSPPRLGRDGATGRMWVVVMVEEQEEKEVEVEKKKVEVEEKKKVEEEEEEEGG